MMRYLALPVLLIVILFAGCSAFDEQACTLIGCEDGLSLRLIDAPMDQFLLEVEEAEGEIHQFECGTRHHCDGAVFIPGVSADRVTVRVTVNESVVEREVALTYDLVQPNGPGCPPICRQATAEVSL
jgi:hypothetical protein